MTTTNQVSGSFRVCKGRDYVLKSAGSRITITDVDRKSKTCRAYLHSVGRHAWIPVEFVRYWYNIVAHRKQSAGKP